MLVDGVGNCRSYARIWYGVGVLKILRSGIIPSEIEYFAKGIDQLSELDRQCRSMP